MRTTIDLPDELFREVKARAALTGVKLKELITAYVEEGLRRQPPPGRRARSPLPIAREATGQPLVFFENSELNRILDDEDATESARS